MPLFPKLLDFIQRRMRMSHIYRPVMLTTLLRNDGAASVRQIAQQFAQCDEALIEYYAKITKEMPGRVLGKNHGMVTAVRGERNDIIAYRLNGYSELSAEQRELLVRAYQEKQAWEVNPVVMPEIEFSGNFLQGVASIRVSSMKRRAPAYQAWALHI